MATNCTRTRKRWSSPIEDVLWGKRQAEETARLQREEEIRCQIVERNGIRLEDYEFARDDEQTFLNPDGSPARMAMVVKVKATGKQAIVVCELVDGEMVWSVMACAAFTAPGWIEVMKARLAFNQRERLAAQG